MAALWHTGSHSEWLVVTLRNCQQITFVTLNRFCLLSNPLFLMNYIQYYTKLDDQAKLNKNRQLLYAYFL